MLTRSVMLQNFNCLTLTSSMKDASELAHEYAIFHLPVVDEKGVFRGNLSLDHLNDEVFSKSILVSEYASDLNKIYASENSVIFDVLSIFQEHELTALAVLNDENELVGLLRLNDIIAYLAKSPSYTEQGAFLTLELNSIDYNLQEISRIVESNNAKILSIHFEPNEMEREILCTLKINERNLDHILATFERFDYQCIAHTSTGNKDENLDDRYDLLMKYLNI